jgi:ABC-type multidrug transport system ATPase subunit
MAKGPNNTQKTVTLPGGKKQRFNSPEQAARVKYIIGYIDQTSALHPGITLDEMLKLMADDTKVAINVVLKIEEGMADRLREEEGRPKVSKNVKAGGPKNA